MPTSSQSQILSVVDYHLLKQQQFSDLNGGMKFSIRRKSSVQVKRKQSRDNRRVSARKQDAKNRSLGTVVPPRSKLLHMPVINLYSMTDQTRRPSIDNSLINEMKDYSSSMLTVDESDKLLDQSIISNGETISRERRLSFLNENTRRLFRLGTIRPSKTFYKDLPEADVDELMEYFRRIRHKNQQMTSEEFNQEYQTQFKGYKPKIFFDSTRVTKVQIKIVENLVEQYVDQIRTHRAELIKVDNPMRFIIKGMNSENNTPLITIPREYNDCLLTLITRSDSLRQSNLISDLIQDQFYEDMKANSLDISYFPDGINYEHRQEESDKNGQITNETYQKLKNRLRNRQVRYFNRPPEKKPLALLAILPVNGSIYVNHQQLLDCLYDRLKTYSTNKITEIQHKIISIEFLPLTCILDSNEISNQYIINCDTMETKQQLIIKPIKLNLNKQFFLIEFHSYDEDIQREYEKFLQAEKYRELIKNYQKAR
ncbi:hypothetical protein I4U23_000500 [Adineta vaga]|nr:hypothetical protein I4U23_000500 [Adineta vaga]